MTKGGKRYANMDQDGKWFVHEKHQSGKTQDASANTGSGLVQELQKPTLQAVERYPKIFINPEKKTMGRKYPFSEHDNRATLQDNIDTYDTYGLGRKKCLGDQRQHNSHFCVCHDGSTSSVGPGTRDHSAYQSDFLPRKRVERWGSTCTKRFPRSHLERAYRGAMAQDGECCMWFGRHDLDCNIPLNVLAAANHSS